MVTEMLNNGKIIGFIFVFLIMLANQRALAQLDNWPYESDRDNKYIDFIIFERMYQENGALATYSTSTPLNSIALYQRFLSKGQCQFYPSCSRYAHRAIQNLGVLRGLPMAAERLSRCHPWAYKHNRESVGFFLYDPVKDFWHYNQAEKLRTSLTRMRMKTLSEITSHERTGLHKLNVSSTESSFANPRNYVLLFEENIRPELKFACSLFKEKNFFRAVTEFKRCLFYFPNSEENGHILLLIAISLYQSRRYPEVHEYLNKASLILSESELRYFVRYLDGLSYYSNENYEKAIEIWRSLLNRQFETSLKKDCILYLSLAYLKLGDKKQAISALSEVGTNDSSTERLVLETKRRMSRYERGKSPFWAAMLSSLLPGSGQIYSGRVADGITSLALTGLFTFLTIDSYRKDYAAGQVIGGLFGIQFYLGNIIGAKRAAYLYNEKILDNVAIDIGKIYNPSQSFDIELKQSRYFLVIH